MPIFEYNGKKYNVKDEHIDNFMQDFPEASTIMEREGKKYRVKSADYKTFMSEQTEQPQQNKTDVLTGFGEGVKQGAESMYQGAKYAVGETARIYGDSQRRYADAIAYLDEQGEDFDPNSFDVKRAVEDDRYKRYEKSVEQWRMEKAKRAKERENLGFFASIAHKWNDPSKPDYKDYKASHYEDLRTGKAITAVDEALKEAGGDIQKARAILEEKSKKEYWGEKVTREAGEVLSQMKQVEGAAWWGSLIPQMAGQATAVGASFIPYVGGALSKVLAVGSTAGLSVSSAGSAMKEARDAGATDGEIMSAGALQAGIEYLSEKIPLERLMGKAGAGVFRKGYKAVSGSVDERELARLLTEANKRLGGKLFSGQTAKEFIKNVGTEAASEFIAEGAGTFVPIIYEEPENYPTLAEAFNNAIEGAKAGAVMGGFLGGVSMVLTNRANEGRRKKQGAVTLAQTKEHGVVEVLQSENGETEVMFSNGKTAWLPSGEVAKVNTYSYDEWKTGVVNSEYHRGYEQTPSGELAMQVNERFYEAERNVRTALNLYDGDDIDAYIGNVSAERLANGDENVRDAVNEYRNAKAYFEGVQRRFQDTREMQYRESDEGIERISNNGMVFTTGYNGETVHITGGNVVLDKNGTVDYDRSSDALYITFPNGRVEMVASTGFAKAVRAQSSKELKDEGRRRIDNEWRMMFDNAEAKIVEQKKRDNGLLFEVADRDGTHTVEVLETGEDTSKILFDGEARLIGNDELNSWRATLGNTQTQMVDDIKVEQSADNGGERVADERNEGGTIPNNVQGGDTNGTPQGNKQQVSSSEIPNNTTWSQTSNQVSDQVAKNGVRLSDEVDENGRQFVLNSNGDIVFGEIAEESGLTPAPILLSEGLITNPATNDGYGLVHIEARHGEQIRNAGYNSVVEFVEEVARNYEVIREGKDRDGHQTYMLQLTDRHNNTLMVELSRDSTYWNINTAGIFKTSYGKNRKEVYNRHTTAKQSTETVEASQDAEQSGTQATSSMNTPTTSSEDKGRNSVSNSQENEQKSAQKRRKPMGFKGKAKKTPEELFAEEKEKAVKGIYSGEYAKVLIESNSVEEAISKFNAMADVALEEIEDWATRQYKKNNTVVTGQNPYSGVDEYQTTIGVANERRREANIERLKTEVATLRGYADILAERTIFSSSNTENRTNPTKSEVKNEKIEDVGRAVNKVATLQAGNSSKIAENGNNTPQNIGSADLSIPAMQRIPKDEQGNPIYEQADSDTAWDAIVEQTEGDETMAQTVADGMVADKEAALKKLEKAKSKGGATIAEKINAEKERKAAIDAAQQELNIWKKIAGTANRRKMEAEVERRRIAEEAAALRKAEEEKLRAEREEAERIEREALNGVPDMVDDKPQDARARGYRRVNGHKIDRQEPLQALQGKEVSVRFSDDAIANGRVAVIDATQLQPSHVQGVRNPLHFIDEAQPKERNDEASVLSARKIAGNIRPEEITSSVTAYTGAPTVNARGEAIQGNNRSDALRLMWESYKDQAEQYKQYLKDHADEFGLRAEDIDAVERPVLVNMLNVEDAEAINLGQFVAQDTESGGTERIKPKNALQKMGTDMRTFANLLLASNDEDMSFAGLVDENGASVLKWMSQKGYITPTQYKSAFDSKGNLTAEAKNDLRGIMYQSIFKGGSTRLEEMFNALPAKAQKAILATAFRDYDSPSAERMIEEIQNSIRAFYALSQSADFVEAKTCKDARLAVEAWKIQYQIDDVTGESYLPAENFSNFALLLATMYKGENQSFIQNTFNRLYDLIQGTQEADLFNTPDNTPRTLAQAIKEVLNLDYDGRQRKSINAVSDVVGDGSNSKGRRSDGNIASGGERAQGTWTAEFMHGISSDGTKAETERESQSSLRTGDGVYADERRRIESDSRQGEVGTLFQYFTGSLAELISQAKQSAQKLIKKVIAPVSSRLKEDLSAKGLVIDDEYKHVIDNNAVRHTLKKHSGKNEEKQGQIPIIETDFEKIADVVENYDEVEVLPGNTTAQRIIYQKAYPNGTVMFVEEQRIGRKELAAVTMWKKKNPTFTDANRTETTQISDLNGISDSKGTTNSPISNELGEKTLYRLNTFGSSSQMLKDMEALRKSNREEFEKIQPVYEYLYKAKDRGLYPSEFEELKGILRGTSLESKVDSWFTPMIEEQSTSKTLQNSTKELNLQKENESNNESNQNDIPVGGQISQSVPQGEHGENAAQVGGAQETAARLRERIESTQGDSKSGLREVENHVTREFAQENGLWIEDESKLGVPFPSGDEHNNYIDAENQVVYKVNNRMHTPSILDLLDRIEQHNKYFPNTQYRLVGFTAISKNGDVMPVFAQGFVPDARMATVDEIDSYMSALGFTPMGNGRYSNGEIIVKDLHPRNVLADVDGDIYVVDAEFEQAENSVKSEVTTESEVKNERIEDVGEKIGGAKKDLFGESIENMKSELKKSDESLIDKLGKLPVSKIFNFDFQKLREGGMPNEAISLMEIIKKSVPAKPRTPHKLKRWVDNTLALYKLCLEVGTDWEKANSVLNSRAFVGTDVKAMFDAYMAVGGFDGGLNIGDAKLKQLDNTSGRYDDNGKFVSLEGKWYVRDAGKNGGVYDSKEDAVNALKAFAGDKTGVSSNGKRKDVKFAVYGRRGENSFFIALNGKSDIVIQTGFSSSKEAFDYIEANNAELQERYRNMLDKSNADFQENRPRKGRDYRNGKDVSAEEFRNTFGFRGVEFGNWMNQDDRKKAINECYDALMDLATVCRVSPRALSLGGTLGMAFGARGGGKFSAHYEADKVVINLTKTKGAGSLAHEWFHALDNYFAKMGDVGLGYATAGDGMTPNGVLKGNKRFYDKTTGNVITEEEYNKRLAEHGVRGEMADAWEHLMDALGKSDYYKRSLAYARLHNSDYWKRPTELGARAFSVWVENELSKQDASNDYLANNPRYVEGDVESEVAEFTPYPFDTDAVWMDEAFGNLFEVMQEKVDEDENAILYRSDEEDSIEEVNEQFNRELQQQIEGTLPEGHIYKLGMPSAVLKSAGLPNLPIELAASRLSDKSMQENHPFELSEIKGLVEAVQNPLAVFRSATHVGSYVVLTEIQHKGKNYVVAIETNRRQGRIEVNSVRSVHYRNSNTHIANWIQDGLLEYVDKKRMSEWFSKQQYNSADVRNLFRHTAKVVESFENPNIEDENILYRNADEIEAEYPNWLEGTTTDSGKHSTQVEGTRKTYKKVGDWIEENLGKDIAILDASSGMGYGTADLRERGFNIEDVEPYQSEDRKQNNPATYSSYADIDKQYDYIISNAVLNVIPDDWRAGVLHDMADKLKTGGKLFINTRKAGEEKFIKDKIELDSPQEVLVKRNGRIASYQRFFTPQELKEWVESELGDGFTVEIANKANSGTNGLAAVVVTKNEGKKTSLSERSGVIPGNSSSKRLLQAGNGHLSTNSLTSQEDVAKLVKNTENTVRSANKKINEGGLNNLGTVENAVRKVGEALKLIKSKSTQSFYGDLYEGDFVVGGETLHLRISTHPATGERMGNYSADDKISIVIYKNGEHVSHEEHDGYSEYTYYPEEVSLEDASNAILKGVVNLINNGEFVDETGKAHRQDYPFVNEEGNIAYRIFGGNSGYVGYSMSKRAAEAREEGRFPKTDFKKEYGVSEKSFNLLVKAGIIDGSEWHHTSMYGNKTTFYKWDEPGFAEYYAENKKVIDKAVNEIEKLKPYLSEAGVTVEAVSEFNKAWDDYSSKLKALGNKLKEDFYNAVENKENTEDGYSREGAGSLFETEVAMESDPYSKALGKPRYTGKRMGEFVARQREKMTNKVQELAEKLNLNIEIIQSTEGLTGKKAKAKGWYEPSSKRIVVVIPNNKSVSDVVETVLHEAVAHHGLREMFGEHFDTFLDNVFNNVDAEVRAEIERLAEKYKGNIRVATEEYLASLAETQNFERVNPTLWERIKAGFINMLAKVGVKLDYEMSDNELRYILWRSYQNLANPGMFNNVFGQIKDTAKQYVLEVGEYAPTTQSNAMVAGEDTKFRFIGEKGAANLDKAEEASTRLNNLAVAREMETVGKDAKGIKLATGWERGADGKWRYETGDVEINRGAQLFNLEDYSSFPISGAVEIGRVDYNSTIRLTDLVNDDELFTAYPEMERYFVSFEKMPADTKGSHSFEEKMIRINKDDIRTLNSTLVHEIQHAIQHIEGFAKGGNSSTVAPRVQTFREDVYPLHNMMLDTAEWAEQQRLLSLWWKEEDKAEPDRVYQMQLQERIDEIKQNGVLKEIENKQAELIKKYGYDRTVINIINEPYSEDAEIWGQLPEDFYDRYEAYNRLAGEVEARTAQERMGKTAEERRNSLAEETYMKDVAREDQIFIYDNLGVSAMMGSRVDARMAQVATELDGRELSNEQRDVANVFGGKADNLTISVKTKDGNTRNIVMRQGNETHAGTKHSLYRHFGMNNGAITTDDILLIPEILANGERTENGKKSIYKLSKDGVEYTVITEYNKGREEFTNFYTNRKASPSARKTRSEEARASNGNASEDKGSTNFADVQEDETRFRITEEEQAEPVSIEEVRTTPLTFLERITQSVLDASAKNKQALELRAEALRMYGRDLAKVLTLMKAQKEYDRATVDALIKLAKMYFQNAQLLGHVTPYEVNRMLGIIHRAIGKRDISKEADHLVEILVEAHTKELASILDKAINTKATKVNMSGVEVMGSLDKRGQIMTATFNEAVVLDLADIERKLNEAEQEMDNPNPERAKEAEARVLGLMLAKEYKENISEKKQEIKDLKNEIAVAQRDAKEGVLDKKAFREFKKDTESAIVECKLEIIDAYHNLIHQFSEGLKESSARAQAFRQAQIDRVKEIRHNANSDMEGKSADIQQSEPDSWNNGLLRTIFGPMATFQQMLKKFGEKSVDGKGYLYNRFMPQVTKASDTEFRKRAQARMTLNEKLTEIFGKKMRFSDLLSLDKKMPGMEIAYINGASYDPVTGMMMPTYNSVELSQGQMLYLYMINKMADGRMKLRRMGITVDIVEGIKTKLDPRFVEFADWVQDVFLKNKRNEYNVVHERLFGAPMGDIENYFPIKIQKRGLNEEVDVAQQEQENMASTVTGAVIKRRKNAQAVDLSANAFNVLMDHIDDMEHWAAFAELNRDLNTLLSYKHFKNQVMNMSTVRYGSGKALWDNFRDVARIATGNYKPKTAKIDKAVTNMTKAVSASKINFRLYTAVKQLLSAPAFWTEAGLQEVLDAYFTPDEAWNWAIENLPGFAERWQGRMAGNERLKPTEADWKMWRNKWVEKAIRGGMWANAAIDAVVVATGAKAVYETKLKQFVNAGYPIARAGERALQAASEAFNESQQSSDGAYMSAMQMDRTLLASVLTTFKNSNFGYTRKTAQSLANLIRKRKPGYKEESVSFMAKQLIRDGLTPENAQMMAEKMYNRSLHKDVANVAMYGFALNILWALGAKAVYLFFGDDKEEKEEMMLEALGEGMLGPVQGVGAGGVFENLAKTMATGDWEYFPLPGLPAMSDIENITQLLEYDKVRAAQELINMLVSAGVGVNPQTFTDVFVALEDMEDASAEELGVFVLRFMSAPQGQIDALFLDDAMENSGADLRDIAQRYVEYKTNRQAPLTKWAYSDEEMEKVYKRYAKRFNSLLEDRLENVVMNDTAFNMFYDNAEPAIKMKLFNMRKDAVAGDDETGKVFKETDIGELILNAMFGKKPVNEVYYGMATIEDEDERFLLKHELAKYKRVYDAGKALDGEAKSEYERERERDLEMYKTLKRANDFINKKMNEMAKNPHEAEMLMRELRERRDEAVKFINDYDKK